MDGVVNVHKPAGPTSHDVVYSVRKLFGQKRVGHAGTLDPMATGVLVVCLGKATRLVEYLMGQPKEYRARMVFGVATDTQDSSGVVLAEADASSVTREALEAAIGKFVGDIEQVPPMMSALKYQGKRLYELHREGKTVERAPRPVTVYGIDLLDFTPGERAEAELLVKCSSGTYIRTLCADIGDTLGCGGHMSMLERTRVGSFHLEDALTVEQLQEAKDAGKLDERVVAPGDALADMPAIVLSEDGVREAMHGMAGRVPETLPEGCTVRMVTAGGELIGVGVIGEDRGQAVVRPKKVFADLDALGV